MGFIVLSVPDNNYETILPLVEKIKEVITAEPVKKLVIID
jgi:hypothetical protein